jgi:hypothetical protein
MAIFAKGSPGTKVHVDFVIVTSGAHGGATQAFASHTDHTLGSAGTLAFNIKILVKPYAPGQATLTMKAVTPGGTIQAKRTYHYVVTSS